MSKAPVTPSQTIGPFFHFGLLSLPQNDLTKPATKGERIRLVGRVLDGHGDGVPDAMIDLWQANAAGRYDHPRDRSDAPLDPAFIGFGRSGSEEDGGYWFETIKPGTTAHQGGRQAPHLNLAVFARGLLNHLWTRVYFEDEGRANDADPVLRQVPAARRSTLMAKRAVVDGRVVYTLDVVLRGEAKTETVFFEL